MDNYSTYNATTYTDIPMIQRDYVQGDDRNAEKRDKFLLAIFKSLAGMKDDNGNPYSGGMDFIYGTSIDQSKGDEDTQDGATHVQDKRRRFMPIDGQQRLTTLALIGWLLAQKSPHPDYRLPELKYRTRHTTEQFCKHLMAHRLPANCPDIRRHLIEEPIWMAERWLADPSVNAMLDLLVAADEILTREPFASKIGEMADKFFTDSSLTFELLDMEKYKLTEDLYIKMNARGKHLSEFENWKAEFTAMLDACYKGEDAKYEYNTVAGETLRIPEYFSYAIEHEWTDLLWPASFNDWNALDAETKARTPYPRIDEKFMKILDFVTKALFYSQYPASAEYSEWPAAKETENVDWSERFAGKKSEWLSARYIDVYRNHCNAAGKQNVCTLFNILDTLSHLSRLRKDDWQGFFERFLYSGRWEPDSNKINIFDTSNRDVNLFGRCLEGKLTISTEFLLWGILNYCVKYPAESSSDKLTDYTRVLWGWVLSNRQRLVQKKLDIEPNVRVMDYPVFDIVIRALASDADVYVSLDFLNDFRKENPSQIQSIGSDTSQNAHSWKAEAKQVLKRETERWNLMDSVNPDILYKLMGCHYLKGDFSNLYPSLKGNNPSNVFSRFKSFYIMGEWDKAKVLIEHSWIGCRHYDNRYAFYGKNEHWDYVFTSKEKNTADAITSYLEGSQEMLPPKDKIEYYARKYKDFFDAGRDSLNPSHLYYVPQDFYATILLNTFTFRVGPYQLCPYAYTVGKIIDPKISERLDLRFIEVKGDHGCLSFNQDRYWLECIQPGWRFEFKDSKRWQSKWNQRFERDEQGMWMDRQGEFMFMLDENNYNILLDIEERDRIEQCIAFLTALYELI